MYRFRCWETISLSLFRNVSTTGKKFSTLRNLIDIHPQVEAALSASKPVLALESTIITHGMPKPQNLELALQLEDIVIQEGCTPATIAVIDGRIKVGLTGNQLKELANCSTQNAIKCSRRDLAYVVSKNLCGGTTVAGTLIIANMVGIRVFATGGLGGVHRDGHITMDISADLIELGRTPVAVVSSGVKSILDIPKTLEYLETQGVCVATYGSPSFDFPAFYTRSSGTKAPYNLNNSEEAAALIYASLKLNLKSGILIGVPVPEEHAISEQLINNAIDSALLEAKEQGINGKEITPFILKAVSKITEGKSVETNIAFIKNNARIASRIAVDLHKLYLSEDDVKNKGKSESCKNAIKLTRNDVASNNVPVIIGGSNTDICLSVTDDDLKNRHI